MMAVMSNTNEKTAAVKKSPKRKKRTFEASLRVALRYLVTAFIFVLLFTFVFGATIVKNENMAPAVKQGDFVLYYRLGEAHAGDVIVFEQNDKPVVARVFAVAGDTVDIREDGALTVNGTQLQEAYSTEFTLVKYPLTVPDGAVFAVYDNAKTGDSRTVGSILPSHTEGVVITILRHRGF